MSSKRRSIEVFSLAFLDIIACAFGAVILIISFAKKSDEGDYADASQIAALIQAISGAEAKTEELTGALTEKDDTLSSLKQASASTNTTAEALESELAKAEENLERLTFASSGLEDKLKELRLAIQKGKETTRDEEVGGIPVDSDYIIFIIDTSGSMRAVWPKVMSTLREVLNNHPKVKGFQVMTDNGDYLLSATKGKWRKDSESQRKIILNKMKHGWGSSNSSPLEGIKEALGRYARKTNSLSLYVFGDEYNGGSYDQAIAEINNLNYNKSIGKKVARIHGIGFMSRNTPYPKFATFMRAVTEQNNGSFININ